MKGVPSFLTSRTAEQAQPVLLKLFREEEYVRLRVARRLGVHYTHLWRWLRDNPKVAKKIEEKRVEFLAQEIEE